MSSSISSFISSIFLFFIQSVLDLIFQSVYLVSSYTSIIFSSLFYSWFSQIGNYGIIGPAILVILLGITGAVLYVVFIFFDAAEDVLP